MINHAHTDHFNAEQGCRKRSGEQCTEHAAHAGKNHKVTTLFTEV
ncbi:hypothetical protein EVA_20382 [gut metagenome]|uniref:Uncharacterized protein n=1 Tax=gut metagenome TaxID=749906 RepID=J9F9C5_9ZZZZ